MAAATLHQKPQCRRKKLWLHSKMQNCPEQENLFYQNYENIEIRSCYAGSNRYNVLKEAAHADRHNLPDFHNNNVHVKTA